MLSCQKELFQLSEEYTYLNCAYMSPQSRSVEEAGMQALKRKGQPYLITPQDFFTEVKKLTSNFAKLIDAEHANRIAIIPSVSYGIANAANNASLETGDTIVVVEEQFPSNIYMWRRLAAEKNANIIEVGAPEINEGRGKLWNERLLEAIDVKTKVIALPHVHWADGTLYDLVAIRKAADRVGARLVIDGTQSVGALPFSVKNIRPDALICGGYKWLMGPYSICIAYYNETFDNGIPIEENWINRYNSEDFSGLVQYEERYQPMAKRYSVGEHSNFVLVPMLNAAIDMIHNWGISNIQKYCDSITSEAITELQEMGFSIEDEAHRGKHLFGVRMPSHVSIESFTNSLKENKISVSVRGNAVRVSPHVYNTLEDVEQLVECCKQVV